MRAGYVTVDRLAEGARFLLLAVVLVAFLFPFLWILKSSFEPSSLLYGDITLVPADITIAHYDRAIEIGFLNAVKNSLVVAIGTTILTTAASLFGAYSVLRFAYPGRRAAARLVLLTYMFPHVALIVPMYQLASTLDMLGNPVTLIVLHSMLALPFCLWILQAFLDDVPRELEEAALVEGATELQAFRHVTIPQATPGIIAAGTFAFIMSWGEYMFAYVLMTSSASHTVPVALFQLLGSYAVDWGLLSAVGVIATLPVLALFWLMAKYLGKGIAKGTGAV
ncbi:carbohydrate ABC transporter permease [Halegenticoccus tardaugens]|uniref:carbohydrate ABC transporter permease n=1 Tax=Halegenticoccus tardaugens TaxID=2071624 RepID=UPI00100A6C76|nr:carbohydrate ABC transporter permease [Halegenticoccus tardaugens]